MKRKFLPVFTLAAALNCAAAAPAAQPEPVAIIPGALEYGQAGAPPPALEEVLILPASVAVNEAFQVTVVTYGSGCDRAGDASAILTATGAAIMVYDLTTAVAPHIVCPAVIKRLPHSVQLRFVKPGRALIRVWGRRVGRDTPPLGEPLVIERTIEVR